MERARDRLHLRRTTEQHVPEVEVQVKRRRTASLSNQETESYSVAPAGVPWHQPSSQQPQTPGLSSNPSASASRVAGTTGVICTRGVLSSSKHLWWISRLN
ncbi:SNURF protein isoform X2 [Microcebus murinus]|uniref:SNURF protein isoform X2 n=1 Tax=Microcebus murinus TaxID=30608 RepID=UPI003F6B595E